MAIIRSPETISRALKRLDRAEELIRAARDQLEEAVDTGPRLGTTDADTWLNRGFLITASIAAMWGLWVALW